MAQIDLFGVWRKREAALGRRIRYREVSQATGISPTTLARWVKGRATRFDAATVEALCSFFHCEVGELIVLGGTDGSLDSSS